MYTYFICYIECNFISYFDLCNRRTVYHYPLKVDSTFKKNATNTKMNTNLLILTTIAGYETCNCKSPLYILSLDMIIIKLKKESEKNESKLASHNAENRSREKEIVDCGNKA